jgi:hypothetical protein
VAVLVGGNIQCENAPFDILISRQIPEAIRKKSPKKKLQPNCPL